MLATGAWRTRTMRCRLLTLISGVSVLAAAAGGLGGCASQSGSSDSESSSTKSASTGSHASSSSTSKSGGGSSASSSASTSAGPVGSNAGGLGPYTVSGNKILDKNSNEHFFRGLDRPSLEWSCSGDIQNTDYQAMSSEWGANIVRLPLNQDCWLSTSGNSSYDPTYAGTVDQQVQWATENGMDIILDLHWSDQGSFSVGAACLANSGGNCQQDMADTNSVEFWKEVATKYANNPAVIFELYNEPKVGGYAPTDANWVTWLNGGTSSGYTVVGMQQLYTTVRATGANNIVIIGGLDWSFNLTGVMTTPSAGPTSFTTRTRTRAAAPPSRRTLASSRRRIRSSRPSSGTRAAASRPVAARPTTRASSTTWTVRRAASRTRCRGPRGPSTRRAAAPSRRSSPTRTTIRTLRAWSSRPRSSPARNTLVANAARPGRHAHLRKRDADDVHGARRCRRDRTGRARRA